MKLEFVEKTNAIYVTLHEGDDVHADTATRAYNRGLCSSAFSEVDFGYAAGCLAGGGREFHPVWRPVLDAIREELEGEGATT